MKKNYKVFNTIIGYDDIKENLIRIIDVLNNQEKYKKIGSRIPHGLLLHGKPGTGKTSIAKEFLDNCNRKSFIIRKNKSDGDFINYLNNVFKKAIDNQPAIILLDDLDKFSEEEEDTKNKEEFVAIQSLIDSVKDEDIFIIATANNIDLLPDSLLRAGRFDIKIRIDNPNEKDSFKIFEYYLSNKSISKDVNVKNISYILTGSSCADLEKVCNQAGIYAVYNNKKEIHMNDLLRASLEYAYNTSIEDLNKEDTYTINVAYHEAGHALIGELLEPNSVQFITTLKTDSDTRGLTKYRNNDNYWDDISFMINRIKTLLAGKAATEVVFNTCDTGVGSDLRRAYYIAERVIDDYCMIGFDSKILYLPSVSEIIKQNKDINISELVEKYYYEVKELLIQNRKALDTLAKELFDKKILFQSEIRNLLKKIINKESVNYVQYR